MDIFFPSHFCTFNCLLIYNVTNDTNSNSLPTSYTFIYSEVLSSYEAFDNDLFNSDSSLSISMSNDSSNSSPSIPKELSSFNDVFIESSANVLPPHCPYDCAINLKENFNHFYGPIYPLTDEESNALEDHIKENFAKGFIRKSNSPAGAPVLFVHKKNGKLCMCMDYRRLNDITIRHSYPFPLIQDTLEHLGKRKIFSKRDLKFSYNPVRIKSGGEYIDNFQL